MASPRPRSKGGASSGMRSPVLAALAVVAALATCAARAEGFAVRAAEVVLVNDIYMVHARLRHELSAEALEALANGIGLTVQVEIEFTRPRRYLWDSLVARAVHTYRLQRHELSNQYLVIDVTSGRRRNYASLDAAVAALDAPPPMPVIDRRGLPGGVELRAHVRTRLDIEALPAPLRPVAWLKPGWRLSSGWHSWSFRT